jgi:ubiquinone/menaquinone biosynthesis C-methylase UbiE
MTKQSNQDFWKDFAGEYAELVGEEGDVRHKLVVNPAIFSLLGNLKEKTVLDAGCGNGYLTRKMAETAKEVTGIDLTEKLIEIAKSKNNPPNVKFLQGSVNELPFDDKTFDTILSNLVLMDVEDLDKTAKEFLRVLKTGGNLVISILHPCFENPPKTYSLYDENKKKIGRVVQEYYDTGLIKDESSKKENGQIYQHYHRTISDYLNTFADTGLKLSKSIEPNANEVNKQFGTFDHTPTFWILKFEK